MEPIPRVWKSRFLTGIALAAAALLILSERTAVPVLLWYGVMILAGAGFILFGLDDIRSGVERHRLERQTAARTFYGAGDLLFGVLGVVAGAALFSGALILWMRLDEPVLDFFSRRPGPVLLVAGLALVSYGLSSFLRSIREESTLGQFVTVLPRRLFVLAAAVLGSVLLLVGLWELVAPAEFDAVVSAWLEPFRILTGR